MRRLARAAVLTVLLAGLAGPAAAATLEGCWEGHWQSTTEKFHGIVKARITRCDATHYKCVFTGWAFKIMPYRYTVTLKGCTDPETGRVHFKCTRKLPIWGMYWMNGCASDCTFFARYHTDENRGYFKMHRVCCK
jgi:hypothetical protein